MIPILGIVLVAICGCGLGIQLLLFAQSSALFSPVLFFIGAAWLAAGVYLIRLGSR